MKSHSKVLYLLIFLVSSTVYSAPQISQSQYLNKCMRSEEQTARLEYYRDKCGVTFTDEAQETMTANTKYCFKLFPERINLVRQKGLDRAIKSLEVHGKKSTCESFLLNHSDLIK